ncbi:MAG TPA: hypothetical protein VNM47_15335 [Terriglobia bacterium]|nr:hypothetical protein [Terriglobia bacterium]
MYRGARPCFYRLVGIGAVVIKLMVAGVQDAGIVPDVRIGRGQRVCRFGCAPGARCFGFTDLDAVVSQPRARKESTAKTWHRG